ncbi:hypothetical protein P7L53_17955 [Thermoleptolyngbya sichuanensis XZ-Cy5]|uniref:hypothetical protein n=1 Tax=Thermoleptolyngbya sichuanensis TaxID=2885951 RepID=UPI00240E04D5|nr:hypothetical protein [Thermoleptolyngbya sichuanensis]MDG2618129.1 hypothetical protein [Thermoleptolyngbya sichuanensis XZ-Cy5]
MRLILIYSKRYGSLIAARSKLALGVGLGIGLSLYPSPASANGGSALLWTGLIHLVVGNLVIAYLEAGLLSWWFGTPRGRSLLVLVAANYASAWAGALLLVNRLSQYSGLTIENIRTWLAIATLLAFLITLIVEYPFVWLLLRQHKRPVQTALKATLLIHGLSYLLLFGWYSFNSQTSLISQMQVMPAAQLQPRPAYTLHYLSPDGAQALRLTSGETEPVAIDRAAFDALSPEPQSRFGPVPKLAAHTDWDYYTHVFSAGGLLGINRATQARQHFALETPFAVWAISHATHLPDDWLVFQLDRDQICLLHPASQRIALIARGKDPVVTLSDPAESVKRP